MDLAPSRCRWLGFRDRHRKDLALRPSRVRLPPRASVRASTNSVLEHSSRALGTRDRRVAPGILFAVPAPNEIAEHALMLVHQAADDLAAFIGDAWAEHDEAEIILAQIAANENQQGW